MDNMSLQDGLVYIMENYTKEKLNPFKENKIAIFLRQNITTIIEKEISGLSKNEFIIKGSAGAGNWAEIPWICIFNKNITISAQKGIYIVFLFSSDMKRVYLSINQGFTFYKENNIVNKTQEFSQEIRKIISEEFDISPYLNSIDLNAENELGKGYESCNIISKEYKLEDLKSNNLNILGDLIEVLEVYDYLYERLPNNDIDIFYNQLLNNYKSEDYDYLSDHNTSQEYNINLNPHKMINHISKYIESKGFIFDDEDIANLYLSMKTKPFVLMAGISGTGKSKLIQLFANAIGANSENGRFRLISVKPDWNDGTELFGYIDINGNYVPGLLTEIAYEANQIENKNNPYIICLDEMNLARVEYYLSDYLSLIETRFNYDDEIKTERIFPKGYFMKKNEYQDVYLSDNIIIVGTVNMDDTTFSFSEKVLDRANTIEFSKVNLELLEFNYRDIEPKYLNNSNFKTSYLTIKDAVEADSSFVTNINNKIIDIYNIMKKYNRHFGYRIRDEIIFYMLENKNCNNLIDENRAFDYQLLQKILPRINGSDYEIKLLLIDLFNYLNPFNQIYDTLGYLDNLDISNSSYKLTSNKIIEMLRSYENGYVSFW